MKKSVLLLISWILTIAYLVYAFYSFMGFGEATNSAPWTQGIVFIVMLPHLIVVILGLIFNILGWALKSRGFSLTGAILYTVGMVFMPPLFIFLLAQAILSYIGFALTKKQALIVQTVNYE